MRAVVLSLAAGFFGERTLSEIVSEFPDIATLLDAAKERHASLERITHALAIGDRFGLPSALRAELRKFVPGITELTYDQRHMAAVPSVFDVMSFPASQFGAQSIVAGASVPSGGRRVLAAAEGNKIFLLNQTTGTTVHPPITTAGKIVKIATADGLIATLDDNNPAEVRAVKVTADGVRPDMLSTISGASALAVVASRSPQHIYVGDHDGFMTAYNKNGTMTKRIHVTGSAIVAVQQMSGVLYWLSAHEFGVVGMSTLDGTHVACRGWASDAVDLVIDQANKDKAFVVLSDGDVLMFNTLVKKTSQRTCELVGKLPRIFHAAPQLVVNGNQAWALQPSEGLAYALELGYYQVLGTRKTNGTVLVPPTKNDVRNSFTLLGPDVEVIKVTKGKPLPGQRSRGSEAGASDTFGETMLDFLENVPNTVFFGIAVVLAVMWNVRKVNKKRASEAASASVEDDEWKQKFQQRLYERRAKAQGGGEGGGLGGLGDKADMLSGILGGEKSAEMQELFASMKKIKEDAKALKTGMGAPAETEDE
jgi:hypothetical protein